MVKSNGGNSRALTPRAVSKTSGLAETLEVELRIERGGVCQKNGPTGWVSARII